MSDDLLSTFVDEAHEHLEVINQIFMGLEEKEFEDKQLIEDVLRELHSLKGTASMVGLADFSRVVHSTESMIKNVRSGEEEYAPGLMDIFFEVADELTAAVEKMVDEGELQDPSFLQILLDKLFLFVDVPEAEEAMISSDQKQEGEKEKNSNDIQTELENKKYREIQQIAKDLGIKANLKKEELIQAIVAQKQEEAADEKTEPEEETSEEEIPQEETEQVEEVDEHQYDPWDPNEYGEIVNDFLDEAQEMLETLTGDMIKLEEEPGKEVIDSIFRAAHTLKGSSGMIGLHVLEDLAHTMEEIFDEVREDERDVTPEMIDLLLLASDKIGEILSKAVKFEPVQVETGPVLKGLRDFKEGKDVDVSEIREKNKLISKQQEEEAEEEADGEEKDDSGSGDRRRVRASIRVDIQKLDRVINQVGELVINKGRVDQKIEELKHLETEMKKVVSEIKDEELNNKAQLMTRAFLELTEETEQSSRDISRLISNLQESVMSTRMVPIAQLFNKYPRLVRDLSRDKGKKIDLVIEGKETELDKTVIEQIGDPLMHIIRNAVDHGMEMPEERKAAGKSEEGELKISAGYEGDLVVIEISDNGGGIDSEKVKEKAIEKGVITAEEAENMAKSEIQQLIFKPGFSTADRVTETSGRGVGMDVVIDNIRNLSGSISLDSTEGEGTTFKIKLPLTLAIIQVLLVRISEQNYALPLSAVSETLRIDESAIDKIGQKEVFELRGETISLIRLKQVLGQSGASSWHGESYPIVVVESGEKRIGILVDDLIEKKEIVIKDLGTILNNVKFVSGATIMGDGTVIIIVDIGEVVQKIDQLLVSSPEIIAQPSQPEETSKINSKDSPGKKILIAEDDTTTRNMLKTALANSGYQVLEAVNGREGYELCQQHDFDLISTDIQMPKMGGYELVKQVRALPHYKYTPILMVSSLEDKLDKMRGFDAGVDDYLQKPFSQEEYVEKIKNLV